VIRLIAILVIFMSAIGNAAAGQDELISYLQSVSADQVDSSLPHIPLKVWLKNVVGASANINWERGDCDLVPEYPEPKEGNPTICINFIARLDSERIGIRLLFLASTTRFDRMEPPQFLPSLYGCYSKTPNSRALFKLSDLPGAIKKLRDSKECK
jgi:hypothetical protein